MDRRTFLKRLGIGMAGMTCGGVLAPGKLNAQEGAGEKEFLGILIDTTRCIGCRSCELACAETYDLPIPDIEDDSVFEKERRTTETQWTIVNRYETDKGTVYAVKRCMHCNQPACVAACLVKAMKKQDLSRGRQIAWGARCAPSRVPLRRRYLNPIALPRGSASVSSAGISDSSRERSPPALRPVRQRPCSSVRGESSLRRPGHGSINILTAMFTPFTEKTRSVGHPLCIFPPCLSNSSAFVRTSERPPSLN